MIKLKENPIEGKTINMGGNDMIVPALNLKKLKEQTGSIMAMDRAKTPIEQITLACSIIHSALQRNYPEIELSEVEELIDMTNLQVAITAVLGQVAPGELRTA